MDFRKDHILPTVRIQKIEMENFKSVTHGEVLFNCGRKFVPQDTESDILGIYGQNGSGKTAVIEAIAILKRVMSGENVHARYSECVSTGKDYASLAFTFDLQYPDKTSLTRTVTYSFKMQAVPNDQSDEHEDYRSFASLFPNKVKIFDETISASGFFGGEKQIKQDILTTSGGTYPIGPVRKIPYYVGDKKDDVIVDLEVNKRSALKDSKSFVFMNETLEVFYQNCNDSEYFQILLELQHYASFYLYAGDTRTSGISAFLSVPLNTRHGVLGLNLMGTTRMPHRLFEYLE